MLNVIPEYHGKKVGKALILKVLEDAKESRWPRFDLFTWSGNIKAMPLYKKCGFFWERKNDTVHLMNFLPYLYQTEAFEDYLKLIDTYKDSVKEINLEHDGREEKGFEFYRYDFQKEDKKYSFEFEKTGRGLRYVDTPEYTVKVSIQKNELVFDNDYEVDILFENKTKEPINIKLVGKDNKNITFKLNEEHLIEEEILINKKFHVGAIKKSQDKGKTHPVIEFDLYVNGKKMTLKTGIEPKYPVNLKLHITEFQHVIGKEYKGFVNIENNYDKAKEIKLTLPNNFVTFNDIEEVSVKAKGKKSIPVTYKIDSYGYYKEKAVITVDGKEIHKEVESFFKGAQSTFTVLNEEYAGIVSGNSIISYGINNNSYQLKNDVKGPAMTSFFPPQIGMPYSLEFSNIKPLIEFDGNDMIVTLKSNAFKDVIVKTYIKNEHGLVTINHELINNGPDKEFCLSLPVWHNLRDAVVPYDGKLLMIDDIDGSDIENVSHLKIDENWFYCRKFNYGFTWNSDYKVKTSGWKINFDFENFTLKNGESFKTKPFYLSYVHENFRSFRRFAGNLENKDYMSYLELSVNNGNPFNKEKNADVTVINHRKSEVEGTIEIDNKKHDLFDTVSTTNGIIESTLSLQDRIVRMKKLTFKQSGEVTLTKTDDSLVVNNGLITFKSSEKYADSVYSLVFNGKEWLDSNYPTPKERAWWADFVGGISIRPSGIQDVSIIKEKRNIEFVELKDNFSNEWKGTKTTVSIDIDPKLKGFVLESYSLTLPGVPVLHTFTNIINNTGELTNNKNFFRFITLKVGDDKHSVRFTHKGVEYKANDKYVEVLPEKYIQYSSDREYDLGVYNPVNEIIVETQKDYLITFSENDLTIPDGESKQLRGDFIILTKEKLNKDMLEDLYNIRFEV